MAIFIVTSIICFLFIVVNFFFFLFQGKVKTYRKLWMVIETLTAIITPILFLLLIDLTQENNCCTESAIFSPDHRIGIYLVLFICIMVYFVSIFRTELFTSVIEVAVNLFLLLGLIINILLCVHLNTLEEGPLWWIFGNIPIILLILIKLSENQQRLKANFDENPTEFNGTLNNISSYILNLEPIFKFPVLLVMIIPILILLSLVLLLFGQKPDSLIRAFTDTYKHGFSQLDYMCDNVNCGGHFLCSVGANGHKNIVQPIRYGERNGNKIICTRQLLISNAFEELIQEKFPKSHNLLRSNYNKVGNLIHKHYGLFNIKLISDIVYLLMKPLEWIFLIVLYTFCKHPENRIAVQYLSRADRDEIDASL